MTRPVLKTSTALVCGIAALAVFLIAWFAHEYQCLQRELAAARRLNEKYAAEIFCPFYDTGRDEPYVDLSQLRIGCLYVPVTRVDISDRTIDREMWDLLCSFRFLDELAIQSCTIEPSVDVDFSVFRDLQRLEMTNTRLSARQIGTAAGMERLTHLYLASIDANDESVRIVPGLHSLQSLTLSGVRVTNESVALIGRLANLEWLDLSETGITDESLRWLSTLKSLARLRLSNTNVTDAGVAELRHLPRLASVRLDGTRITRRSLSLLAEIPTLERDEVYVDNTAIDAAELERWRAGEPVATEPASE